DPSTLDIGVIITDRSLFTPARADAATIEGYGPVPYEHVREEMSQAYDQGEDDLALVMRRMYTDPEDGQLVAVESRARSFPPSLARFIRWAHQTCRGPYCEAPIRHTDHIRPRSRGGPTSLRNANGLCADCNQKEQAEETARVVTDHRGRRRTVAWTTRYGQTTRRGAINYDPVGTARRRSTPPVPPAPPAPPEGASDPLSRALHRLFHPEPRSRPPRGSGGTFRCALPRRTLPYCGRTDVVVPLDQRLVL